MVSHLWWPDLVAGVRICGGVGVARRGARVARVGICGGGLGEVQVRWGLGVGGREGLRWLGMGLSVGGNWWSGVKMAGEGDRWRGQGGKVKVVVRLVVMVVIRVMVATVRRG